MFTRTAIAIAFACVSTIAIAQSNPPSNNNSSTGTSATAPHSNSSMTTGMAGDKGLQVANSATMAVRFVTVKPAELMTSRLIGTNVYNNQNEALGEIEDLVVENGKTIGGVVVSVGGFLGIGDSYVVLDPSTIVLNERDGKWRAFVDTTKDNLKSAPKFNYTKKQGWRSANALNGCNTTVQGRQPLIDSGTSLTGMLTQITPIGTSKTDKSGPRYRGFMIEDSIVLTLAKNLTIHPAKAIADLIGRST